MIDEKIKLQDEKIDSINTELPDTSNIATKEYVDDKDERVAELEGRVAELERQLAEIYAYLDTDSANW